MRLRFKRSYHKKFFVGEEFAPPDKEFLFKNYIKRKIIETKDWRNEHSKPIRKNTENKNTNVDNSSQKENGIITKEEFHSAINKVKSIASQYKIPEFKYWAYENDDTYEKYTKDKYDVIIIAYLYFGDYVDDHFNGDPDEWIDSDGYKSFDNATKE